MSFSSHSTIVVQDQTDLEAVHFTLKWSIHDFAGLKNKGDWMYSPGITMAELGMEEEYRGRWQICIVPCNSVTMENNGKENYVSIYLTLTDADLESTFYTGERTLACVYKERVTTGKLMDVAICYRAEFTGLLTYSSADNTWGKEKLISHRNLFGSGANALKDSCLHIEMEVIIYREPKTIRASEAVSPSLLQRYQEFLGRQLKQQEEGGDFLLISNDNKEFCVDRSFLMAHSPVFTAMLNHDSKEKQTSRCEMKDVDGECVEILLDYVCGCETGKIHGKNAEKILVMADKYQMADLRAVCELVLAKNLTVENAIHVFGLARLRNLGTLKDLAMQYIRKNMDLETVLGASLDLDL